MPIVEEYDAIAKRLRELKTSASTHCFSQIFLRAAAAMGLMTTLALSGQPLSLAPSPALAPGLSAFPRLKETGESQVDRINRALQAADARVRDSAKKCTEMGGSDRSEWSRNIAVTMRGPRYLSLVATDNWFCGGAHPDSDRIALVYDLSTGAPVDWAQLLPAGLVESTGTETAGDGTVLGLISSTALKSIYVPAASQQSNVPECNEALADAGLKFMLWLDAKADGIYIQPAAGEVPHALAVCIQSIPISMAELRRLGVGTTMLDAIDEAHNQGWHGMQ